MKMQMNTKILMGGIILCIVIAGWLFQKQSQECTLSDLTLENINALARGETDENYFCLNSGDVDCYGHKVRLRIDNPR